MKLTVNVAGTEAVRRTLLRIGQDATRLALDKTAEDVHEYVANEAGKHTQPGPEGGALFKSAYFRRAGDGWEIGHDLQIAPHALFVHWGTRAHIIRPKRQDGFESLVHAHTRKGKPVKQHTRSGGKRMLRWGGDQFTFAREVHHPGYAGDPWLVRAAQLAPSIFERHVAAQLARIL